MQYRFFIIPALEPSAAEQQLNQFCASQRVASIDRQFVNAGTESFWSICVCYQPAGQQPLTGGSGSKVRIDYREVLSPEDFAIFAKLRTLRKEISDSEGIPAYGVFSNAQLAAMVEQRVTTLTEFGAITSVAEALPQ